MSRIGKLPISIPDNLKVNIADKLITIDSGKVKKTYTLSNSVKAEIDNKSLKLIAVDKNVVGTSRFLGLDRSNLKNIIQGLQKPFSTTLEINGVGYKASVDKGILSLTLGYSHDIFYCIPKGVNATIEKPNLIIISGDDKVLIGQVVSEIKSFRKTEPYKGKGIKKVGEFILRKEGKKK